MGAKVRVWRLDSNMEWLIASEELDDGTRGKHDPDMSTSTLKRCPLLPRDSREAWDAEILIFQPIFFLHKPFPARRAYLEV